MSTTELQQERDAQGVDGQQQQVQRRLIGHERSMDVGHRGGGLDCLCIRLPLHFGRLVGALLSEAWEKRYFCFSFIRCLN